MERPKRKAINFDLDTETMKEYSKYPIGYELLRVSFKKYGFEHRQGSGYISKDKLMSSDVTDVVRNIVKEQPWLSECVKKIDVTDIGKQHDLTAIVKEYGDILRAQEVSLIQKANRTTEQKTSERDNIQPPNKNTNKVKLTGVLSTSPTSRKISTQNGERLETIYSIAVPSDGRTDVIQIVSEGKQAELDAKYLKQGNCVQIEGSIQSDVIPYNGFQIPTYKINASKVKYLVPTSTKTNAASKQTSSQKNNGSQVEF